MSEVPFFIVITKPNKQKIQTYLTTDTGKDLEDVKNKLVYIIQEHFSKCQEFPDSYEEFINKQWYQHISADSEPFDYRVFSEDKWIQPWSSDDLYEQVVEVLHKLELLGAYITEANKDEEEFDEAEDNGVEE